jgi:hypothetical protein
MPYLTCIGGHGVLRRNVNEIGSRGYWVFRRGSVVVIRYGPVVQVREGKRTFFRWVRCTEEKKRCGTSDKAKKLLINIVSEKTATSHGYTPLGPGVKIR